MTDAFDDGEIDNLLNNNDHDDARTVSEAKMEDSQHHASKSAQPDIGFLSSIPVHVTLEVASTEIPLKELLDVDVQSVIAMDKVAGEPLDVKVNGTSFAKAEVVVLNGNYGLRIVELTGNGITGLNT